MRIVPDSTEPASGTIIAVEVDDDGDINCTKADGGPWTSAAGGYVEFYLKPAGGDWDMVGHVTYDEQPGDDGTYDLYDVTLPSVALSLGEGEGHAAQCIAIPSIDVGTDPGWETCGATASGEDIVCTRSGVFTFNIESDGGTFDTSELDGSCGAGDGNGTGNLVCVEHKTRSAGTYVAPFACDAGSEYEVKLTTSAGSTALIVGDGEGHTYGSSQTTGSVDRIDFTSSTYTGGCYAYVYALEESTFSLQVKDKTKNSSESQRVDSVDALLQAAQPGDILLVHRTQDKCQWWRDLSIIPALFCHTGIVSSAWPNFLTVEAAGSGTLVAESDRYEYWSEEDDETLVALMRVEGARSLSGIAVGVLPVRRPLSEPAR